MSETTSEKALRLIAEGRVSVTRAGGEMTEGEVVGDTGETYALVLHPRGDNCTCAAYGTNCSHLKALRLVTTHQDLEPEAADAMPPTAELPFGVEPL